MSRPEVVVFDLGKVLLNFDYGQAARRLAARSQSSLETVRQLIDQSPLLFRYESGLLTRHEFFEEVRFATGFQGDLAEFAVLFGDIFTPIDEMVELAALVHRQAVSTFILSNTNDLAIDHIRRRFPFFQTFGNYVFSYEQGAMKPEARLYEVVEQRAGKKGERILFLDDRPENLVTAAQRGWQTILHETPPKTRARFHELGFAIN